MKKLAVYLFRNDLRLFDNIALFEACQLDLLFPMFILDPQFHFDAKTWHYEFPRQSKLKNKFLYESLSDLKSNLKTKQSDLFVFHGKPKDVVYNVISTFSKEFRVEFFIQQEVTHEEIVQEAQFKQACDDLHIPCHIIWGSTLVHKRHVDKVPDVFTHFRKNVEKNWEIDPCVKCNIKPSPPNPFKCTDIPTESITPHPNSAFPFEGGETAGKQRVHSFIFEQDLLTKYKSTRDQLIGPDYSTKFSPYLTLGCISPRYIYECILKKMGGYPEDLSAYWVIFELLWRDYFKFIGLKYPKSLFYLTGPHHKEHAWATDLNKFKKWATGTTGVPFVDANMRELLQTGYMSNRGRQNVASFFTKDLKLDWRMGAEWFESQLLDHDPASNYGNWLYAGGVAFDPRGDRKFNVIKQSKDYDPDGQYLKVWLPELKSMTAPQIHTPWLHNKYLKPIVIAPEWNRHIKNYKKREPFKIKR